MFRKTILIIFALFFALGVLGISVMNSSTRAQIEKGIVAEDQEVTEEEVESTDSEEVQETVDYSLPYPGGILPGHFLYPVKMIRDRIWLWLTTDALKKAELLLHFADKRLETARVLIEEKGEAELGVTTATKAEKYLEQAINQERTADQKDKDTKNFLERASKATLKHEEVLLNLKERVNESAHPAIESCLGYARRGYSQVKSLLEE